jgi:hypothetical protein
MKKFLSYVLFTIVSLSSVALDANKIVYQDVSNRPELVTFDQEFVFFNAGGKMPVMKKFHPGDRKLDVVLCGYSDQANGSIELSPSATDLAHLIPVQYTQKFPEIGCCGAKVEETYEGFRESVVGKGLQSVLNLTGLLPLKNYKGALLVDEYQKGLPMKMIFPSAAYFKGFKTYFLAKSNECNVFPAETKPLLMLEILDTKEPLDDLDIDFLNSYYTVVDPKDELVKSFFKECNEQMNDILEATHEASPVKEGYTQQVVRGLEKEFKEFKVDKIAAKVTLYLASTVVAFATWKILEKTLESWWQGPVVKRATTKANSIINLDAKFNPKPA